MSWIGKFITSSVGAKVVMALTGVVLVGFVFGHMVGNLQVYAGREAINNYAEFLQGLGGALWVVRGGLILALMLHVVSGIRLAQLNRAARPQAYAKKASTTATWASRTMPLTGLVVLAFLVYHLMHFTAGNIHAQYYNFEDMQGRHDVYAMFITSFRDPAVAISYIVAIVLLGMHLKHSISSAFQSLGLTSRRYAPAIKAIGPVLAILFVAGNLSFPISIFSGAFGKDVPPLAQMQQADTTHPAEK